MGGGVITLHHDGGYAEFEARYESVFQIRLSSIIYHFEISGLFDFPKKGQLRAQYNCKCQLKPKPVCHYFSGPFSYCFLSMETPFNFSVKSSISCYANWSIKTQFGSSIKNPLSSATKTPFRSSLKSPVNPSLNTLFSSSKKTPFSSFKKKVLSSHLRLTKILTLASLEKNPFSSSLNTDHP